MNCNSKSINLIKMCICFKLFRKILMDLPVAFFNVLHSDLDGNQFDRLQFRISSIELDAQKNSQKLIQCEMIRQCTVR